MPKSQRRVEGKANVKDTNEVALMPPPSAPMQSKKEFTETMVSESQDIMAWEMRYNENEAFGTVVSKPVPAKLVMTSTSFRAPHPTNNNRPTPVINLTGMFS